MVEKRFDTKHQMLTIVQDNNQLRFATDDGLFFLWISAGDALQKKK